MGFTFNRSAAMKAGKNEYIQESGVYVGKFIHAVETNHTTGAISISFDFVSNDDQKVNFLRITTVKKDGTPAFGMNHIYALMGLLKLPEANPVKVSDDKFGYPMFCNKQIGVILQKEIKDEGKFGFNILHFVDPVTLKTFTEQVNNEEAKESKKEIKDRISKSLQLDTSFNFGANVKEDKQAQFDSMFGPAPTQDDLPPWDK